jgi:hypothetical protein
MGARVMKENEEFIGPASELQRMVIAPHLERARDAARELSEASRKFEEAKSNLQSVVSLVAAEHGLRFDTDHYLWFRPAQATEIFSEE